MKALVYYGNRDLRLESVDEPSPAAAEVKIKVDYCGICATDIEEYLYGPVFISGDTPNPLTGKKIPLITGHEITGTVVELGASVSDIRRGQRVVLNGVLTCKQCWWCKHDQEQQCPSMAGVGFGIDGGLAEYMVWPADQVVTLPDNVTSEEAALVEPASVAMHAVRRTNMQPGNRVVILGVGTVGLLALQVARTRGAIVYAVDRRQISLDLARELGADAIINSEIEDAGARLLELTNGVGADIVIDAAGGSETPALAVSWTRRGGRVLLVAIYTAQPTFDFNSLVGTEVEMAGSLAYQQKDIEEVVRLISDGDLKTSPLISDTLALSDVVDKGFARMMAPTKDVFRILVDPSG